MHSRPPCLGRNKGKTENRGWASIKRGILDRAFRFIYNLLEKSMRTNKKILWKVHVYSGAPEQDFLMPSYLGYGHDC